MQEFVFVAAGALDQLIGAAVYDRRMIAEMQRLGVRIAVRELPDPALDPESALSEAAALLSSLPDESALLIEGLALPAFDELLAGESERLRVVSLVHHCLGLETGLDPEEADRLRQAERRSLRRSRGVITPSAATAGTVEEYAISPERIAIVPPGSDLPPLVSRHGGTGPIAILAAGSVIPRKGHADLVRALAALPRRDWKLTIAGSLTRDLACAEELKAAIRETRTEDRVRLAGELQPPELAKLYEAAEIFALASHYEGYGLVFAEAMGHGLPIVTTTAGAIPDTVPASAGMLVPPGDIPALAAALDRMMEMPALRHRFGLGARAHAERLPDWSKSARLFLNAFTRLSALAPA